MRVPWRARRQTLPGLDGLMLYRACQPRRPWYVRVRDWFWSRSFADDTATVLGLRFTREFAEDFEDEIGLGRWLLCKIGGWR